MMRFEDSLRRGLMDANLVQFGQVLQGAESAEPDFSPAYLRERMRLLADPWGWMQRRELAGPRRRGRLNWRLVILIAALLLLSACAVAVVTGQFSQWFPSRGVNYQAPEESEAVLSRTGTVIGETWTEGDAEITLNAASWDGERLLLSLVLKSPGVPGLPEDYLPGPADFGDGLHTAECYVSLGEGQWLEYEKGRLGRSYNEAESRERFAQGYSKMWPTFQLLSREDDTLTYELAVPLFNYVERPEMTFHLENINFYQHEGFHIPGPIEFTFTLEKTIPVVRYKSDGPEVTMGRTPPRRKVPMRFTEFAFSSTGMDTTFQVLKQVIRAPAAGSYELGLPEGGKESDPIYYHDINYAFWDGPLGLWMEDGSYVDLTDGGGVTSGYESWGRTYVYASFPYPYPIDPAQIAAVDIGGVRVELSELERMDQ